MNLSQARQLEQNFIDAVSALRCAHRNMKSIGGFETTTPQVAETILDIELSSEQITDWIKENKDT